MTDTATLDETIARLAHSVMAGDTAGMRAVLHPDASIRALVPKGLMEASGVDDVTGLMKRWFSDLPDKEVLDLRTEALSDRWLVAYRMAVTKEGRPSVVEQHAVLQTDGERVTHIDLVCTGFRPAGVDGLRPAGVGAPS